MDRPEVKTSWAASLRKSSGYFDGLPNGDSFLRTATAAHYLVSSGSAMLRLPSFRHPCTGRAFLGKFEAAAPIG
jgi:hypothetical protein